MSAYALYRGGEVGGSIRRGEWPEAEEEVRGGGNSIFLDLSIIEASSGEGVRAVA